MDKLKDQACCVKDFADRNIEWTYGFAALGAGFALWKISQCLYATYKYALRPAYNLQTRYGQNWAVITGASDGLGKAFAFELAKRGFKLVLVARDQAKLDGVSAEIQAVYKVDIKTIVFDFDTHYTDEKIEELRKKLEVIDKASLLINNVGTASYKPLDQMKDSDIHKQLNVNVVGNTVFTKLMIPKLLANETKSGCIFIGSSAYESPNPNLAVYSASKCYEHQLSLSLAEEHRGKIDFMVSRTADVKTNMNTGKYVFAILPHQHAKHVLDKLGHDTDTHGHYKHALRAFFIKRYVEGSIINYINLKRKQAEQRERESRNK